MVKIFFTHSKYTVFDFIVLLIHPLDEKQCGSLSAGFKPAGLDLHLDLDLHCF